MADVNDLADRVFHRSSTEDREVDNLMSSIGGPKILISNEPELRLEMKELEEDGVEWRFLAYAEENKALLETASRAGSYCNAAYLKAIKHNLAIARMACQLEIDSDYRIIEDVFVATERELSHLQRHPELFPSKGVQDEFWHVVWLTCNSSMRTVILGQEARDHAHEMFQAAWVESKEGMHTPRGNVQRKPWEQFLHNRAPGTGADLSMFEEGSIQIIPMAAARILMANIEEHKAIIRDIEAQREDLRPYAQSPRSYFYSNGLNRSPDGHLRSHQASTDLLKPTTAGPMDIVRRGDMDDSLETLNLDFAALNRRRPPLRPLKALIKVLEEQMK